jgi:hypothetical protein
MTRPNWKLVLDCFEIVLILMQDWCIVCSESAIGSKINLDTPDGILGDVGPMESYFGPFRDSVSVGVRYVHGLRQTCHRPINHYGHT